MRSAALLACVIALVSGCLAMPVEIGSVYEGTGAVRMRGDSDWKIAERGSIMLLGDEFRTTAAESAMLSLGSARIGLGANSAVKLLKPAPGEECRVEYSAGDLFALIESQAAAGGVMMETPGGVVLVRSGAAMLRIDPLSSSAIAAGAAPAARVQVVVIDGESVVENGGRASKLAPGDRVFLETGRPPSEIKPIPTDVLAEFRWALDRALGRDSAALSARPPLFEPAAQSKDRRFGLHPGKPAEPQDPGDTGDMGNDPGSE